MLLVQFWMLDYAAEQDFFSSEFFFWVDATGSFRSAPALLTALTPSHYPRELTVIGSFVVGCLL